jgi:hypothetical protein
VDPITTHRIFYQSYASLEGVLSYFIDILYSAAVKLTTRGCIFLTIDEVENLEHLTFWLYTDLPTSRHILEKKPNLQLRGYSFRFDPSNASNSFSPDAVDKLHQCRLAT